MFRKSLGPAVLLSVFLAAVTAGRAGGAGAASIVAESLSGQRIAASLSPSVIPAYGSAILHLQIVDAEGDPVSEPSVPIDLVVSPGTLLDSYQSPVFTDPGGHATADLVAGGRFGLVALEPVSVYPGETSVLSIDPWLASLDEAAPESDPLHNSNPDADLTAMFATLGPDTLTVRLDFESSWSYVLLMVALETNGDVAGGATDPFDQPIYYGHSLKPDYVFTYKYSSDDYADLRKPGGSEWLFWQLGDHTWTDDYTDPGKNAVSMMAKAATYVEFSFPLDALGEIAPGDTIRVQSYVSQELPLEKYNALDSNPHDATHDMLPDVGNWWETATNPVTLSQWSEFVLPAGGIPPAMSGAQAAPCSASAGDTVVFSVHVVDAGGGIGDVFMDLTEIGGKDLTILTPEDGERGFLRDDGLYSAAFMLPGSVTDGAYTLPITARDSLNVASASASVNLYVRTVPELLISVADSVGDDHGPNLTDGMGHIVDGLYYVYPHNGVFSPGAFDIEQVDLMVEGSYLVFRIHVGELPASGDVGWGAPYPGATCTNPNRADLNLQKVDIYIDSEERVGATAGLPFRFVDIDRRDAWDYAIAIEGWWKGLARSNGENSPALWTLFKDNSVIDFCDDHVEDWIDIKVALSALGDPDVDEIKQWDFIITMASHDGESNDQNMGGSRWVNYYPSEWQFGNGRDQEAGRERDANIMDVVTVAGWGKYPGRSQEYMLNYLLPDAVTRFNNEKTACVLEATSRPGWTPREVKLSDPDIDAKSRPEMMVPFFGSGEGGERPLVRFSLPEASSARVTIHDIQGRLIRTLADAERPAGRQCLTWDACLESGEKASPGIYFVRIQAGSKSATGRIIILR